MGAVKAKASEKPATTSPPVYKTRVGSISVAVWSNDNDGRISFSVTMQRSYKDEKEVWQNSDFLWGNDIQQARKALDKAHDFILSQYASE